MAWSKGRRPLGAVVHASNEPCGHDDSSTINIVLGIISLYYYTLVVMMMVMVMMMVRVTATTGWCRGGVDVVWFFFFQVFHDDQWQFGVPHC